MRQIFAFSLLMAGACNVDTDAANEQVTLEYNRQEIKKTARDAAHTAKDVASSVGNVAASTGRAIKKEVGDVDVDIDVSRNKSADRK